MTKMVNFSTSVQAAFSLFDDDSSDTEQESINISQHNNINSIQFIPSIIQAPEIPSEHTISSTTINELLGQENTIWKDKSPNIMKGIMLRENYDTIGGHRGIIAKEDLNIGTLVLSEHVYIPWPKTCEKNDPLLFIHTMETILQKENYQDIIHHLSILYPQQLTDLPEDVRVSGIKKYSIHLQELLMKYNISTISMDILLQNIFAMQCNAFGTGVFLFSAMFNHDCNPNCIKFTPDTPDQQGITEVRVTRPITKGTPLTISYLYPREKCKETRQTVLRSQFGFHCFCSLCQRGDSLLPPPQLEPGIVPTMTILDIELILEQMEMKISILTKDGYLEEDCTLLLTNVMELLSDALEIIPHDHIMYIRIHKLVADTCDLLLQSRQQIYKVQGLNGMKSKKTITEYAILFLRSSVEVLELQRKFLNSDHLDLVRTLNDISQGIQSLLSYNPKALLEEFPEWENFRQASKIENEYRAEYQRLKRIYEN